MSHIIDQLLTWLHAIAIFTPLPIFVIFGSIFEEVIAIVPSPFVMTLAGSIMAEQGGNYFYLALLSVLAAAAKTAGCYLYYLLADKLEDLLASRYGKYLGISHKSIEAVGRRFGTGKRDEIVIFLLRAAPLIPTAPVSLAAGAVKINLRHYLSATFAGLIVRSAFFLYLGYTATGTLSSLQDQIGGYETYGKIALLLALVGVLLWFWVKRRKLHK